MFRPTQGPSSGSTSYRRHFLPQIYADTTKEAASSTARHRNQSANPTSKSVSTPPAHFRNSVPSSVFSAYCRKRDNKWIMRSQHLSDSIPWNILSPIACWTWWSPLSRSKHVVQLISFITDQLVVFLTSLQYTFIECCILRDAICRQRRGVLYYKWHRYLL
jgi:hypothetical protein